VAVESAHGVSASLSQEVLETLSWAAALGASRTPASNSVTGRRELVMVDSLWLRK